MKARSIWQRRFASHALMLGLAAAGATFADHAMAGCSPFGSMGIPGPSVESTERPPASGFLSTVYRPDAEPFTRVAAANDRASRGPAIVGTWRFTFVSDGTGPVPAGATVDFGTAQWHPDGTELMISGSRPPSTGDVCMGSWEQTGRGTYQLNHIALSWASGDSTPPASPAAYVGPAIIRETVTLNPARNAYQGTFTLDQYAQDGVTLLVHLAGTVNATRFTTD